MQLSSTQQQALDRDNRQYALATNELFSAFVQEQILDVLETGPVGIGADAADIDSIAKGGGCFSAVAGTTSGLVFGYGAGRFHNGKSMVSVSAGTITLSPSATNYVEVDRAGTVSVNTTAFTSGRMPLYTIVTGVGSISTTTVSKPLLTLIGPNGVDGSMASTAMQTKELYVPVGTIGTGAGSTKFCVPVPASAGSASKITKLRFVSKDALATSNTNYLSVGLVNKSTDGTGTLAIVDITAAANTTKATGGSALVAYTPRDLTLATLTIGTERDVAGGDVLELTLTVTGTLGGSLTQVGVMIEMTHTN